MTRVATIMRMFPRWLGRSSILCALLCSATTANAVDLFSASARVEAGFDPATRALIRDLPDDLKRNALDLLERALPLMEQQFETYLKEVDRVLSEKLIEAQCRVQDTIAQTKGSLPFAEYRPIQDLLELKQDVANPLGRSAGPDAYLVAYGDFLNVAYKTACAVKASKESVETVRALQEEILDRWRLWKRLHGDRNCLDAASCVDAAKQVATEAMRGADQRDVDASGAKADFGTVAVPAPPTFFQRFKRYNPRPYEDAIAHYQRIADQIRLARELRIAQAAEIASTYEEEIYDARALVAAASSNLPYRNCRARTGPQISEASAAIERARERVSEAEKLAPEVGRRLDPLRDEITAAASLVNQATRARLSARPTKAIKNPCFDPPKETSVNVSVTWSPIGRLTVTGLVTPSGLKGLVNVLIRYENETARTKKVRIGAGSRYHYAVFAPAAKNTVIVQAVFQGNKRLASARSTEVSATRPK